MNNKPQEEFREKFKDIWVFERAEYLERATPQQDFQLKQKIEHVEDLYAFIDCYQDAVTRIDVHNDELAIFFCLNATYDGAYFFPDNPPASYGKQVRINFGSLKLKREESSGEERTEHPVSGDEPDEPALYVQELEFQLEFMDVNTIVLTLEKSCQENGVPRQGAIKCILKRESTPK